MNESVGQIEQFVYMVLGVVFEKSLCFTLVLSLFQIFEFGCRGIKYESVVQRLGRGM